MKTSIIIKDVSREVSVWKINQGTVEIPATVSYPGSCWLATGVANLQTSSGFDRAFWGRGASGYAVVSSDLKAGDYVENGTKDKKGRKDAYWYRVLAVRETEIVVRRAGSPGVNPPDVAGEIALAELAEAGPVVAPVAVAVAPQSVVAQAEERLRLARVELASAEQALVEALAAADASAPGL